MAIASGPFSTTPSSSIGSAAGASAAAAAASSFFAFGLGTAPPAAAAAAAAAAAFFFLAFAAAASSSPPPPPAALLTLSSFLRGEGVVSSADPRDSVAHYPPRAHALKGCAQAVAPGWWQRDGLSAEGSARAAATRRLGGREERSHLSAAAAFSFFKALVASCAAFAAARSACAFTNTSAVAWRLAMPSVPPPPAPSLPILAWLRSRAICDF